MFFKIISKVSIFGSKDWLQFTSNSNLPPIMIEVKYRENSKITESDLIVEKYNNIPNLVITKNINEFGIRDYNGGKQIYKVSAPVFLYLLGYVEDKKYN